MIRSFIFSRPLATLLLVIVGGSLFAQIPNGYYNSAEGLTGDDLKVALHNTIKEHHVVSYSGLITAFAYTDLKPNGKIWDIYSNVEYSPGSGQCGNYDSEGDCWNREHTWPQSWFNEQSTPRSDLFHVYPTDGYVNGRRSNYPYGEVNKPTYTSGNGSKLGPCVTSGYSGTVFEPIDEYKGDIARGYFYMSVRYYSEDSGWSSSDMTNKSEIRPWAMAMLLRWNDADPVSQKEIDRNNAVYGYQGNRNPFIDHPEYAHMIWDPDWSSTSYAITCNSASHGSIAAPSSAIAGTLVTLTATPDAGYELDTWTVAKTDDASTTIAVNDNSFVMPDYAVTVGATFKVNNTYYTISQGTVSHGSISMSATSAKSGTTVTLSASPANGYSLYSWYVYKTDDINTHVAVSTSGNSGSFVMPAFDVTVLASFAQGSGNSDFVKVTSAPSDWSGEYILVYENTTTQGYVWTGVDAANCYVSKTISDNTIAYDNSLVTLTVAPMSEGYSIKVNGGTNNGKYISGTSGSNTINFGTTAVLNTLAAESDGIKIMSNTSVMRYNKNSDNNRFRYYKSASYTNQQPVQLYKKTNGSVSVPTHTIQFNPNGANGSGYSQTVNEFEPTPLTANAFERDGYAFDSWNTQADGSGTAYFDGTTVSLLGDLVLYAQWVPTFTITCATALAHGSISASHDVAVAGDLITLTASPDNGYELECWTVVAANDQPVAVDGHQFEMPAANVSVSATFGPVVRLKYYLVTDADQLEAGRSCLIVNVAAGKALGPQANNNRQGVDVSIANGNTIDSIGATVRPLVLGTCNGHWTFFDEQEEGYLYAASSSSNHLKTQATLDANGEWTVAIASGGAATLTAQGGNTRNLLRYNANNGSPIFSCYSSDQQPVALFILEEPVELAAGCNWWTPTKTMTLGELEAALRGKGLVINSQAGGFVRYEGGVWSGTLTSVVPGQMYRIATSAAVSLTLPGTPVASAEVTLMPGYNWFGYAGVAAKPIATALGSFTPTNGDSITPMGGATITYSDGWNGDMTLVPGHGYVYYSNASGSKTIVF